MALSLAVSGGAAIGTFKSAVDARPAHAVEFVNDYPNMGAVLHSAANYEWWVDENGDGQKQIASGTNDELMSSRGFDYRNCVDGVAHWAKKYTGVTIPGSWGSAINWDNAATAYTVKTGNTNNIEPGDIAQSNDGIYGHVGFVTSVSKDANGNVTGITTAELNAGGDGNYTTPTYTSKNGSGNFIRPGTNRDWDNFIDVNGAGKGLNGEALPGASFTIHSGADNNKCLEVAYDTHQQDGGKVWLYPCNGTPLQRWYVGAGSTIRNYYTNRCLDVDYYAWEHQLNGGKVQQWACNGQNNQVWSWKTDSEAFPYTIQTLLGRCLDYEVSTGSKVQQYRCFGDSNQKWVMGG